MSIKITGSQDRIFIEITAYDEIQDAYKKFNWSLDTSGKMFDSYRSKEFQSWVNPMDQWLKERRYDLKY